MEIWKKGGISAHDDDMTVLAQGWFSFLPFFLWRFGNVNECTLHAFFGRAIRSIIYLYTYIHLYMVVFFFFYKY
jgi:hypothetical protein